MRQDPVIPKSLTQHVLAHVDFKEYLQSLVSGIADTYKRHDVVIAVDVCIPCGLQLVNVLAGQIHGTIVLSRSPGTRFSVTFPGTPESKGDQHG
ncbi:MAG: hypothetical protein A2X58_08265 [Nitrospirae bacterium GWC2_56_14]|nr:MAG: hypothetical protein A2X58_08265 [Nitrospirae bacterium GWC2_56_14]